ACRSSPSLRLRADRVESLRPAQHPTGWVEFSRVTVPGRSRGHNSLRDELRRPTTGGRPSSAGAIPDRSWTAKLEAIVMSVTAPGRARLASPVGRRNLAIDLAVALVAFALSLAILSAGRGESRGLDPLGVLLAALAALPVVFRRRSPLGVLALTTAASATLNGLDYALGPPVGPTVALFFVAADERTRSRIRETAAVVIGLFAVHIGATAVAHDGFPVVPVLFGILVWGGAFVAGDPGPARRGRGQRGARGGGAAGGRGGGRGRGPRPPPAGEPPRLARDLHDSAGHAINVILVQAGAARLLQERDPNAVRSALQTIEQV